MSFALNTVYNNYMTSYTPKSVTRYDAHKKSELRSVYNTIVNQNKDAPWYLPTTSRETQRYAVDLKENARELRNTLAQLGGLEEDSLFSKKSVYSSDENVATASFIGSHKAGQTTLDLQLEVHSLASSQENLGLFLPDTRVALPTGTYSFDLGLGDVNYEYQFTIDGSETNRQVQDRLARLVNNSGIGIRADLAESDGRTSLRLTSEQTGLGPGRSSVFTVTDDHTSKTNGTVEYFGLDYVSREASNASFVINGQEQTSPRNRFTFDQNYEIALHGVTQEGCPVQVGLKTDLESLTDNVTHLPGFPVQKQTACEGTESYCADLRGFHGTHGPDHGTGRHPAYRQRHPAQECPELPGYPGDLRLSEELLQHAAAQEQPGIPESHGLCGESDRGL